MRAALALCLLLLAGCSSESDTLRVYLVPDCNLGFDAQVKLLTGQPDLVPARDEAVEPYRYFNSADGHVSYVITQPDAPAHPAILIQRVGGERSTTTGCAYGDKAEFAKLKAYIENLKAGALTP